MYEKGAAWSGKQMREAQLRVLRAVAGKETWITALKAARLENQTAETNAAAETLLSLSQDSWTTERP